jgi:OmpA-OmpF porin, OOP family
MSITAAGFVAYSENRPLLNGSRIAREVSRFLKLMRVFLATTCIVAGSMLAAGCATKTYVRNTTAPIQAKVDQVGTQTTQNTQQIEDTKTQLKQVDDKAQSGINAAQERAAAADQHATAADQHANLADQHAMDAMNQAKQVGTVADATSRDLNKLRDVVANIDDYKMQTSASVPFAFDKYALTASAKEDLDKLAGGLSAGKRFVISVEGFTDSTGDRAYNEALSRKRADAVVTYLVAKHDVPIYRIHMIGLGEEKPVDDGKDRAARAKNRRVEVKVFTADVDSGTATTATRQAQ